MRNIALETLALAAVDKVLAGHRVEDDRVEAKRDWPIPESFARQFAGWANSAAGEEIVLILGLDEQEHALVAPSVAIDPEAWWSGVQARFDEQTPPRLSAHIIVPVDGDNSVIAMAFETDRAPYVVKSPDGKGAHLEVPMRRGTGTGWAHRSDLLRMLAPQIGVPTPTLLGARAQATRYNPDAMHPQTRVLLYVSATLFLEHLGPDFVMLPRHAMAVDLTFGDHVVSCDVEDPTPHYPPGQTPPVPPIHGVHPSRAGFLLTGPGHAHLSVRQMVTEAVVAPIEAASVATLMLRLPVSGSPRAVEVVVELKREVDRQVRNDVIGVFVVGQRS